MLLLSLLCLPFPLSIYGLSLWQPTIIKQFGVTDAMTGLLSAVPYLFAVVGLYPVPRHSDRKRERYGHIVVVSGMAAVTMALSAWVQSPASGPLRAAFFSIHSPAAGPPRRAGPPRWDSPSRA